MTPAADPAMGRALVDFARRSEAAEWLDGADLDAAELAAVLRDLAWFNTAMLGHAPILSWLDRAARKQGSGEPFRLIDVGCGYGDLLRAVRRWAERRGVTIELLGLDLNAETLRIARAATASRERIEFVVADALNFRPAAPVDFVVNSLVAHHLGGAAIVRLLRWMEETARRGWMISDLHRHPLAYYFIGFAGKLARLHPTVVHDGQISVLRALTRAEWLDQLDAAGMPRDAVTIQWFLCRWLIERLR